VESVSIGVVSLDLLIDGLKECLLLVGRQEVERAGKRPHQEAPTVMKQALQDHSGL
jgi:hypothetical protein